MAQECNHYSVDKNPHSMEGEMECYNDGICNRVHKYALRCKEADSWYPSMQTRIPGLCLEMCGKKTGTCYRAVNNIFARPFVQDHFAPDHFVHEIRTQPSHLMVRANVHVSLLREPQGVYPCKKRGVPPELTFEFLDPDAFSFFIQRLTIDLPRTEAAILGYFADWARLDANKERRAAILLKRKALEKAYMPGARFVRSQARHAWGE